LDEASRSRASYIVELLAFAPPLVAIFCVDYVPTHDGPKNLYAAHVFAHAHSPAFAQDFARGVPLTASGFAFLYGALEALFAWRAAYRVALAAIVVGLGLAFFALAGAMAPRRRLVAIAGLGAAMQWTFAMGFWNYVGGVALALAALAVGLARERWSARRELAVAALLWAACMFHASGAQIAVLGLAVFRIATVPAGRRLRDLGALFLVAAPIAFVGIVARDALADLRASGLATFPPLRMSLDGALENLRLCFLPGPWWRAWPIVAAGVAGLAFAAGSAARRKLAPRELALLVVGAASAIAAIVAPFHGSGWQYVSPRFIPFAVYAGLALLPVERLDRRGAAIAIALACVFDVASNAWAARTNLAWSRAWGDALAGLGAPAAPGRTLLPIVAIPDVVSRPDRDREREIPYQSPLQNLGELYAVDRDAVTPYAFAAAPYIHVVRYVGERFTRVPAMDYGLAFDASAAPEVRRGEIVRLASYGASFDDTLFFGDPADADALLSFGFAADVRRGRLVLAHFVGCAARLRVVGLRERARATLGWRGAERTTWRGDVVDGAVVDLPPTSCGGVWVRVAGARCVGADESGALFADTRRDATTTIECALEGSP
jgi:hypothetical protein